MSTTTPDLTKRRFAPPSALPGPNHNPLALFRGSLRAWLPLLLAGGWMLGTFGLFWAGALAQEVPNPGTLWLFVMSATGAFAVGYVAQLFRSDFRPRASTTRSTDVLRARRLVLAGGIYYVLFGLALLFEYGATGPGSIIASLQDPAGAYLNKFTVYQQQEDNGRTNPVIQVLTLLGVLGTALVPLLVVHWRRLSGGLRLVGLAGIGVYSLFFLYIGTLKGLGDFVLMIAAGLLIASSRNRDRAAQRVKRRRATVLAAVVFALFCAYMMSSQADRVDQFGTHDRVRANPTVERVAGEQVATGLAALVIYPTHGYLGLAYNLETPFVWSHGLGSTPAITSYGSQYLGIEADQYPAYPVRTEGRTGWPQACTGRRSIPGWPQSHLPGNRALHGLPGLVLRPALARGEPRGRHPADLDLRSDVSARRLHSREQPTRHVAPGGDRSRHSAVPLPVDRTHPEREGLSAARAGAAVAHPSPSTRGHDGG